VKGLTVAITTARFGDEIRYAAWGELARDVLAGRRKDPYVSGEWLSLCASLGCFPPVLHHVMYQLRALALQTRLPDKVIVVDRTLGQKEHTSRELEGMLDEEDLPFDVLWTQPQVGADELARAPHLALQSMQVSSEASIELLPERKRDVPYGNADKNTALVLCPTEWLLMLDDSIIPGYALCETAAKTCERDEILLIGHRALYLPTLERDSVEVANSHWHVGAQDNRVFGIFASPLKYLLAVNGFNTALDGRRGQWDIELRQRMNLYAQNVGIEFVQSEAARTYEVEHDYPWKQAPRCEVDTPTTWRAAGPDLKKMNHAARLDLQRGNYAQQPTEEDDQEVFDEED
jgi:hypothetical protein